MAPDQPGTGGLPPRPPRNLAELIALGIRRLAERQGGEHSGRQKRTPGGRRLGRGVRIGVIAFAVLILLPVVATGAANLWTDALWFGEVGYQSVFWTRLWAPLALAAAGGVVFLVFFFVNTYLARRFSPRIRLAGVDGRDEVLELAPLSDRTVGRILLGVSLVLAFFFALGAGNTWETVLLFLNRTAFGWADPVFALDASFFVFFLPLARTVMGFLWATLIITFLGTLGVYVFDRAIFVTAKQRLGLAPHVKAHLSVLVALGLLFKAVGYQLATWELNFSTRGVTFGASYTDVHAELPVLRLLAGIAVVSAVLFLINIRYRGWRLPLAAVALLVVVWLAAGQIYPAVIQRFRVTPNEVRVESPYIENNIEATRYAFGLDRATTREFPATQVLEAADIRENRPTIDNIRIWDPRPMIDTFQQIQTLQLQYTFKDVDVERYTVDGTYRQVMLAARELEQGQLPAPAKTWVNLHLVYTHGYGLVVAGVNDAVGEGLPRLLLRDIPPTGPTSLAVKRPELYYGEVGNDFVLVKTAAQEFNYPKGSTNVYTVYEGTGGVDIGSFARQAAFGLRFGTLKLLLSQDLKPESRIMFHRTVQERVQAIAPFLSFDRDPYLVIRADGSLIWIWDAYTTSRRFPYSQPRQEGLNYIRNSVKVTIDAYDGTVKLYQVDPDDALATTWGKVFPGLLTPGDQLPEDLRAHLRYPEDLFSLQAQVMATYHMTDPQVFYNKQDVWQIPQEVYGGEQTPVVPYYVIMALPGEPREEFLLMQPFVPLQKTNMTAWMAARMDGAHYGEIVLFAFPRDTIVFGPEQVESFISQDPTISEQVTLWDQAGSQVIRGNMLVIPVEDSLLYVEPLYLQANQTAIPSLKRVITSYNGRVVMQPTLGEALNQLFGPGAVAGAPAPTAPPPLETTTTPGATTTSTAPPSGTTTTLPGTATTIPGTLPTDRAALITLAQQAYEQALAAQRAGDWAEYGRQIEELGRVLETLEAAGQ